MINGHDNQSWRRRLAEAAAVALFFIGAAVAGFLVFIALFRLDLFRDMGILFYRGMTVMIVALVVTGLLLALAVIRLPLFRMRDVVAAALFSFGLNLGFFILLPVTVDRSLSVFLLGYLSAHQDSSFTTEAIQSAFIRIYLGDYAQIERRLDEQVSSGNILLGPNGYRISPQGLAFIHTARAIGQLFNTDYRLITPPHEPVMLPPPEK